jgi:HlyD family secretion protein
MKRRATAAGFVILAAAAVVFYAARPRGDAAGNGLRQTVETAQVQAADFYISLPVRGVLEAARSIPVISLAERTQITWLLPDGTWVDEGQIVVKLNPAEAKKQVDELEAEVAEAEEKVRQTEADAEKRMQNARSTLVKAEDALELARLQNQAAREKGEAEVAFAEKELEVAQGELEKQEVLLKGKLVAIGDVEEAQDKARSAKHALENARRELDRATADAAITERLKQLDIDGAQLEFEQAEAGLETSVNSAKRDLEEKQLDLDEARLRLESTQLEAPGAGMLLIEETWEESGRRSLRVGDDVGEGHRVARIIDPTEMLVRCDINEADIERVRVTQSAKVRVPALGDDVLDGEVEAIDNLARQRRPWEGGVPGRKVFAALTRLTTDDPRLRPGMGAVIEIVLEHVADGRAVPLETLFTEREEVVLYRADGGLFRAVPVEVGKRNNRFAVVEGDLEVGQMVARQRPPADLVADASLEESG